MSKMAFTRFGGQFQFEKSNGGQVRQFWGRAIDHRKELLLSSTQEDFFSLKVVVLLYSTFNRSRQP